MAAAIGDLDIRLRKEHSIVLRIVEAKNLPLDAQDAHCVIRIDDQAATAVKTNTVWRNRNPFWDEEYEFALPNNFKQVNVEVWNKNKFTRDDLVGYFAIKKISLVGKADSKPCETWYSILPAPKGASPNATAATEEAAPGERKSHELKPITYKSPTTCDHCGRFVWGASGLKCEQCDGAYHAKCAPHVRTGCGTAGAVRVRVRYTEEYILPLPMYGKILEFFYDERLQLIIAYGATVSEEREEAARTFVRVAEATGIAVKFLSILNAHEVSICSDPNTLFRANSIASKAVDNYMKLIAMPYLHEVLKPVMDELISANRSCEIDPTRLEKGEELEANKTVLTAYIEWTASRIFESIAKCPPELRQVFFNLQKEVVKKWPDNEQVRFICVSGYIFLRFFNAAILGPKLFGLCSEHPNQRVSRTLTLISKTLQNLANLVRFDGKKEPYMSALNDFIVNNMDRMRMFIKKVSSVPETSYKKEEKSSKIKAPWRKNKPKDATLERSKIDIELELAATHRFLLRSKEALKSLTTPSLAPTIERLVTVLNDMDGAYQKRVRAALEEQREMLLQQLLEEEGDEDDEEFDFFSFLEYLNNSSARKVNADGVSMRPTGGSGLIAPVDMTSDLSALRFPLAANTKLSFAEMWEVLDPNGTGSIPRSDIDLMLGVFALDFSQDYVARAHLKARIPGSATSISRKQAQDLFVALLPAISKPPPEQYTLAEACAIVSGYYGTTGTLTLPEARVISSVGRSKLVEAQLRVILAMFQQAGGSVRLIDFVSAE